MPLPIILAKAAVGTILKKVLDRPDVPIDNANVPATVAKIENAITATVTDQTIAMVNVKPDGGSKILWAQIAGPIATILAAVAARYGIHLSMEEASAVLLVGYLAQSGVTYAMRKWWTTSVLKSSLPK